MNPKMTHGQQSRTSVEKLELWEKKLAALEMRKQGYTFEQIGKVFERERCTIYKWVDWAMQQIIQEPAEQVRKLEIERLDRLMLAHWPKATAGDARSTECILKIMDRRAHMLGLDAPQKHELTGAGGGPIEYADASASFLRKLETLAGTAQEQNAIFN